MTTLQIRQMPDSLYQQLVFRAEQAHRSLNQQAVAELKWALGASRPSTRQQTLQAIRERLGLAEAQGVPTPDMLEAWQRDDRNR